MRENYTPISTAELEHTVNASATVTDDDASPIRVCVRNVINMCVASYKKYTA